MPHAYRIGRYKILSAIAWTLLLLPASLLAQTSPAKQQGVIAFVANPSGSWQLYTVAPDGSNLTQITNLPATDFESWLPAISPDGQRIVFAYGPAGGGPDLYVVNIDGSSLTQLTNDGLSSAPRWSPDGNYIVYAHTSTNDYLNSSYYLPNVVTVIRADGTGAAVKLTNAIWDSYFPFYSPDGQHIFYYSEDGGFVARVWSMRSDGEGKRVFTPPALRAARVGTNHPQASLDVRGNQFVGVGSLLSNTTPYARAVGGIALSNTQNAYGVAGETDGESGAGVIGTVESATGNGFWGYFQARGTQVGTTALLGYASATSGYTVGVEGFTESPNGTVGRFTSHSGSGLCCKEIRESILYRCSPLTPAATATSLGT